MIESVISKDIINSFVGAIFALLSVGIVWFFKSVYEKHRNEKLALAKFERAIAVNVTVLKDNFEFVDSWISALKVNQRYSFHLEKYLIEDEIAFKLSNLKLINSLITSNYKLRRSGADLECIYKNYWEIIF